MTKTNQRQRREAITGYLLIAPSLIGVVLFLLVPIIVIIWLSFHQWDLISPIQSVGFDNYAAVLTDGRFAHSLGVTLLFVAVTIPIQTVLGLLIGTLVARALPVTRVIQAIILIPWACAPLGLGIVWKWILARTDGALNLLTGHSTEWVGSPDLVFWSVCFVAIWSQVGYVSLFFAAGLQNIPTTAIEASRLDGANAWQTFLKIKLPLLHPTTFFVLVTGVISSFQIFDLVYALAPNGGPGQAADVVAGRIYYEAFASFNLGRAAVMSLVVFAILVLFTITQQRIFARRTTFEALS